MPSMFYTSAEIQVTHAQHIKTFMWQLSSDLYDRWIPNMMVVTLLFGKDSLLQVTLVCRSP